ncbi:MAG: hypothetical protein JXA89_26505 [Anaerolineae bacterium]|nr:hypothetical protein [Anaerolineae bacterium]
MDVVFDPIGGARQLWRSYRALRKGGPGALTITAISFLIGLVIAIWGFVPGVHDPEQILNICWTFVFGGGLGGLLVSIVAGFARDVDKTTA